MLAHVQSCLLWGYLAVRRDLVNPHRKCCRSLGLLQGFCLACLSLFSVADIYANGFHSSVSLVFPGCIVQSANTMSVRGFCSCILQRSIELRWYHWGWELWMRFMQSSCTVRSRWDSKLAHDVSPDLHTVCSNRISSTHSISFSFPLAVSLLLSSPTILLYLWVYSVLLLVQICRCLRTGDFILLKMVMRSA